MNKKIAIYSYLKKMAFYSCLKRWLRISDEKLIEEICINKRRKGHVQKHRKTTTAIVFDLILLRSSDNLKLLFLTKH